MRSLTNIAKVMRSLTNIAYPPTNIDSVVGIAKSLPQTLVNL